MYRYDTKTSVSGIMIALLAFSIMTAIVHGSEHQEDCTICFREFEENRPKIELECGHVFDDECITRWVNKEGKNTCPLCREEIKNFFTDEQRKSWSKKCCIFKQWVKLRKKIHNNKKMKKWREQYITNPRDFCCFCVGIWFLCVALIIIALSVRQAKKWYFVIPQTIIALFCAFFMMMISFVVAARDSVTRAMGVGIFILCLINLLSFALWQVYDVTSFRYTCGILNIVVAIVAAYFEAMTEEWMYWLSP